jgi:hypothetical protein
VIDKILSPYPHYLGCISKDQLKHFDPKQNGYYVINIQSTNQGDKRGSHWISLSVFSDYVCIMDSFGCYIMPKDIKEFAKRGKKKIYANDTKFQDLNSSVCGYWAILVSLLIEEGHSPKEIINKILPKLVRNGVDLDPTR